MELSRDEWSSNSVFSALENQCFIPSSCAPETPNDFSQSHNSSLPDLSNPSRVFNPIQLAEQLIRQFWSCRSSLTAYALSSLSGPTCNMQTRHTGVLMPVPPVRWRWTAASRLGPRRRRRRRYHRVRAELLNLVLITLNWETLGFPAVAPPGARVGAFLTVQQHSAIERFEDMLDHFLHMSPFGCDELGRASDKFQSVIKCIEELPRCELELQDLFECLQHVQVGLDPYAKPHFDTRFVAKEVPTHQCFAESGIASSADLSTARPVVSDRVKWESPPSFAADDFLNPLTKAAYRDPEVLRKPPNEWPSAKPARMHCTRKEFLALVARWDKLGACRLMKARDKDFDEAVGIFSVAKDQQYDRLIINPKTINSRMHTLSDSTRELAPGCMLGLLHLLPGELFRFSADDLSDFYYTFKVSQARSTRNAFRMKFSSSELQHLQCYTPDLEGEEILVCLSTLAMGDSLAVEIAQQSHGNVLRQLCGAMLPTEVLKYRSPIPRGDFVELLAIDDHIGIQRLSTHDELLFPDLRDTTVFKNAEAAYKAVGLVQHPRKRKRNLTQGILLGADFDGKRGKVMAPRSRILILSLISMAIAVRGTITPKLLSVLTGCWIHVLMFRRVLFALMDRLFKETCNGGPDTIFCLSSAARAGLQMLSMVGMLAQSDLKVAYSDYIYSTDASPFGGAVIRAKVGKTALGELWRHTEQKGFHTRLQSPVSELLREHGLDPIAEECFVSELEPPPEIIPSIPSPLSEGYLFDCIEIFRGVGNWSDAHQQQGLSVHPGIENNGRTLRVADMSNAAVTHELISLALRRAILDWHAGLPCVSFGTLRRPQVRSNAKPDGFNPDDPFTAFHNMLARRTAFILCIAVMSGLYISVEQPGSSRLFRLHCYRVLVSLGCVISHFAFCSYGSGFRKASKWLHNKPWLLPLESQCSCKYQGNHFVVQGSFTPNLIEEFDQRCEPDCKSVYGRLPRPGETVSAFSASYPRRLVGRMASGLVAAKRGCVPRIPKSVHCRTLKELGVDSCLEFVSYPTDPEFPLRAAHEDPEWIGELCDCLPFRECFRYRFRKAGHININETRTYKSFIKSIAKDEPDTRHVALLDSRVTIGAASKGRSSSEAISRVLKGCVGFALAGNIYPGLLHCYSDKNRSDGPSRNRAIEPPTKAPPLWFSELQRGAPHRFDMVVASARYGKIAARWLRLLLLLGGDIERNPGPGRPGRGPLNLAVGYVPATSDRMHKCFLAFQVWCSEEAGLDWDALLSDLHALSVALRGYGMHLYETGYPRYLFTYAITATQEFLPAIRPYVSIAWHVNKKWQVAEPGQSRAVLPTIVLQALCVLSAAWRWFSFLGVTLLGFGAMLHPSEMMLLVRKDLIFPRDVSFTSNSLFVKVREPKTARFARRQHGRIDDDSIIRLCEALFFHLPLSARLYVGSISAYRKQWNSVMNRLGVPFQQACHGATPGVLRGSGATYLYHSSEDINWVAWRGRWSRIRTLEYYLQEVGAQMLIHELKPSAKARIEMLAAMAGPVLWHTVLAEQDNRSGVV